MLKLSWLKNGNLICLIPPSTEKKKYMDFYIIFTIPGKDSHTPIYFCKAATCSNSYTQ